jgi:hypothetical protein
MDIQATRYIHKNVEIYFRSSQGTRKGMFETKQENDIKSYMQIIKTSREGDLKSYMKAKVQ